MGYHGGGLRDIPATYLVLDTDLPIAEVYQI